MIEAKAKKQTIYKIQKRETGFTIIQNHIIDDPTLTWREKGILCAMLRHPHNFLLREKKLSEKAKDGIKSLQAGIRGLIKRGHIIRQKIRGDRGRFLGYETLVFEDPEDPIATEMPFTDIGETDVGNADIRKNNHNNTNVNNTNFNNTTTKSEEKSSYFYPRIQGGPEADKIVNDVLCKQYPNDEKIKKSKAGLKRRLLTLLAEGKLERPENSPVKETDMEELQIAKKLREKMIADEEAVIANAKEIRGKMERNYQCQRRGK
ncbi:MAG: hypothetical protein CVU54_06960 [Deltaproteobacteria bacterium HGW-Deltaproteobacteria-12]|jgi:hypothetical protein|nr:MAG: hypothetical protein CVU54_06960 [Deltaproteobacteria bacterium HGW-Deltaproteobacteria-12]